MRWRWCCLIWCICYDLFSTIKANLWVLKLFRRFWKFCFEKLLSFMGLRVYLAFFLSWWHTIIIWHDIILVQVVSIAIALSSCITFCWPARPIASNTASNAMYNTVARFQASRGQAAVEPTCYWTSCVWNASQTSSRQINLNCIGSTQIC